MRKCPALNVSKALIVKLYLNLMINVHRDCNQDLPFLKVFVQDTTRLDRCASTSASLSYCLSPATYVLGDNHLCWPLRRYPELMPYSANYALHAFGEQYPIL